MASGEHKGKLLTQVLKEHPEYLGDRLKEKGELPILVKFIDAKENLSIQVHPDDTFAKERENGRSGKAEMWYVLDAQRDTAVVYGLSGNPERDQLRRSVENGTIEKYLQKIKISRNDVLFIKPGTIHAIGAGALIAEIQQNSDLTYRLYDYDRRDRNGNRRELHIEKALEAADLRGSTVPAQPMRVLRYRKGCAEELLCRCKYFMVERMLFNTERCRQMADIQTTSLSFEILLCIDGCGVLFFYKGEIPFIKGDCIFLPAGAAQMRIHGKGQFLRIRC